MNILVANDDGIYAEGIKALAYKLTEIGDVTVVAPKHHQSGKGHAVSFEKEIEIEKYNFGNNIEAFSVDGTPRDCVYFALNGLCNKKFDLVVTGINQGSNISTDCVSSGTCGSACVGFLYGIPSISFSLDFGTCYNFTEAAITACDVVKWYINAKLPTNFAINCNIPNIPIDEIKGWKVVVHGSLHLYHKNLVFKRMDEKIIADVTNLTTETVSMNNSLKYDEYALHNGYVTLQPVNIDLTDYNALDIVEASLQTQV